MSRFPIVVLSKKFSTIFGKKMKTNKIKYFPARTIFINPQFYLFAVNNKISSIFQFFPFKSRQSWRRDPLVLQLNVYFFVVLKFKKCLQ